ncbi:hypothetical protein C2S51_022056 [Perilla frutescens var. frutescens]|nr:hypothetical protein C2S51_022056 [Perilla frutescens var. frutescens]
MASLHTSAPPSYSIAIFRRPSVGNFSPFHICPTPACRSFNGLLNLRFEKELKVQVKKRWSPVSASNTNPSKKSDDTKSSDDASGPPLLTILAGLVVFLFVCWILGSVVMWIIGLILRPPPQL